MVLPVINIGSKLDGKGFKQAETATDKLGKSVKKAGLALAAAFSVQKIVAFGKASVKAFAEDEAAAAKLTRTVNNLGLGFEDARITKFIADLEKSAAVSDDILRPAFQSLLSTTGSVTKSQDLLTLALEISAGTGVDAAQVAKDLGLAYLGQTKGLTKYNTGLTKTELASKSFNDIQGLLNSKFSGQNAARLDTYAGKMAVLGVAAGNAQEVIGKGLVDAISKLGDDDSVQNLADDMEKAAERTADVIRGIGVLVAKIKTIPGFNSDFGVLYDISYLALLEKLGKASVKPKPFTTPMTVSGSTDAQVKLDKARAKAEADAAKRQKELLALQKKSALAEKNKLSLSQAAETFDTNRISIAAALRATYDKETRLRLEALMAIEDEDGQKALDRIEQLGLLTKAKQTDKLNGLKGITETELLGLNTTLLTELAKIEATKKARIEAINASGATQEAKDAAKAKAIADADTAQAAAFAKYNDALAKQGGLNDLSFYSQKTQIQTLEVLRLASLEKTSAAQVVADAIALSAGIKTLEEIAAKRKLLQDADNAAMAAAEVARKAAEDKAFSEYYVALAAKSAARIADEAKVAAAETAALAANSAATLAADASLTTAKLNSIATVAAAEAAANASAIAGVGALAAAIKAIPPYPTYTPPPKSEMPGSAFADPDGQFPDLGGSLYVDPALVNPGGNNTYTVTVNAGAIASQDEFAALLQQTIQQLNRNGDPLTTAGIS